MAKGAVKEKSNVEADKKLMADMRASIKAVGKRGKTGAAPAETPESTSVKADAATSALAQAFKPAGLTDEQLQKLRNVRAGQVSANKAVFGASRAEGRTWEVVSAGQEPRENEAGIRITIPASGRRCPFTNVPLFEFFVITDGVDTYEVGRGVAHNEGYAEIPTSKLNEARKAAGLVSLK